MLFACYLHGKTAVKGAAVLFNLVGTVNRASWSSVNQRMLLPLLLLPLLLLPITADSTAGRCCILLLWGFVLFGMRLLLTCPGRPHCPATTAYGGTTGPLLGLLCTMPLLLLPMLLLLLLQGSHFCCEFTTGLT